MKRQFAKKRQFAESYLMDDVSTEYLIFHCLFVIDLSDVAVIHRSNRFPALKMPLCTPKAKDRGISEGESWKSVFCSSVKNKCRTHSIKSYVISFCLIILNCIHNAHPPVVRFCDWSCSNGCMSSKPSIAISQQETSQQETSHFQNLRRKQTFITQRKVYAVIEHWSTNSYN